jgi:hypothetical protein
VLAPLPVPNRSNPDRSSPERRFSAIVSRHKEARSAIREARHALGLARESARELEEADDAERQARHAFETERDRLDPRRTRPVRLVVSCVVCVIAFFLDVLGVAAALHGVLAEPGYRGLVVVTAAVLIGIAWRGGLARRERSWLALVPGLLVLVGIALLGVLHADAARAGGASAWRADGVAALCGLLLLATVGVGAAVVARTEPGAVAVLRRRWRAARGTLCSAEQTARADRERAEIAIGSLVALIEGELDESDDAQMRDAVLALVSKVAGAGALRP